MKKNELIPTKNRLKRYERNPFIENPNNLCPTRIISRKTAAGVQQTIYTDATGMEFKAGTIYTTETVDNGQFVKFFAQGLSTFFDLNRNAIKVLTLVIACLQEDSKNRDYIYLPFTKVKILCDKYNIPNLQSKNTFTKGMKQLVDSGFIAKSQLGESVWWINPSVLFNGDRLVLAKQYIKNNEPQQAKLL